MLMSTIARYCDITNPPSPPPALSSIDAQDMPGLTQPPVDSSLPLLCRILAGRGLDIKEILDTGIDNLCPPEDFPALAAAIPLLSQALGGRILVIGDYDADGTCSTATLILALRSVGACHVEYRLPNRFSGGYGLSEEMMREISAGEPPALLITVDHGTNSLDKIQGFLDQGIKVLVLDHHKPGRQYEPLQHPDFCIVNPHLNGCQWPDKDICATAVAFFTMASLRNHLVRDGQLDDLEENKPGRWLDMVALATVGDQMPMSKTNRILVEQGLRRIRAGRSREGIRHLLRLLRQQESKMHSRHISHVVVPRLNAAGRVRSADTAVEFLLAESVTDAHALAQELVDLNQHRKDVEQNMTVEIEEQITDLPENAGLICLYHPEWHLGVVGIGASKIAGRLNRPVIVFAPHPHRKEWVGSGRAGAGDNILACLHAIAEKDADVFENYGGHNQAVGATIRSENFDRFKELAAQLTRTGGDNARDGQLITDGELDAKELCLENAAWLASAVVWGKELPLPLFDGVFEVVQLWRLGGSHVKFELAQSGQNTRIAGIRFNCNAPLPELGQKIRAVYEMNAHRFRGVSSLQIIIQHWEFPQS